MVPSACVGGGEWSPVHVWVVVNGPQCMCGGGGEWSPVHVWVVVNGPQCMCGWW